MRLLLCCKKTKPYLYRQDDDTFKLENKIVDEDISDYKKYYGLNNGKIIIECDYEVEEIFEDNLEDARDGYLEHFYTLKSYDDFDEGQKVLLKESCLQKHELSNYLGFENGYAIHIKNVHIFDRPRELSSYYKGFTKDELFSKLERIKTVPRNMIYAYKNTSYSSIVMIKYILASVTPQELCRILKGEQTVLIRRNVLKEMLKNE